MKFFDLNFEEIKRLYERTLKITELELSTLHIIDTIVAMGIVFVLLIVICSLLSGIMKNSLPWNNRIGYALAGAYSIFIIELAIFSREAGSYIGTYKYSMFSPALTETERIFVFLNVLFFIPFGLFLASGMYYQLKTIKTILLTVFCSGLFTAFIECTQKLTDRGYFEVADLEANVLGGFIGALLGVVIGACFYKNRRKKKKKSRKK